MVDPNEVRSKESLKKGLCAAMATGGLGTVAACLGQIVNPGVWALIEALFAVGIAAGPLAVFGVASGLLASVCAIYLIYSHMTPEERAAQAHLIVMHGIDEWITKGKTSKPILERLANSLKKMSLSVEDTMSNTRKKIQQYADTCGNILFEWWSELPDNQRL